jgi:hypothetical protein
MEQSMPITAEQVMPLNEQQYPVNEQQQPLGEQVIRFPPPVPAVFILTFVCASSTPAKSSSL